MDATGARIGMHEENVRSEDYYKQAYKRQNATYRSYCRRLTFQCERRIL